MPNIYQNCESSPDPAGCFSEIRKSELEKLLVACRKTRYYGQRFRNMQIPDSPGDSLSGVGWFALSLKERAERINDFEASDGNMGMEAPGSLAGGGRLEATWSETGEATAFIEYMFRNAGVDESDRFINCYDFSYNGFGVVHQRVCERMGAFCLPAGKVEPVQIFSRIAPYDTTILMGHASLLVQVTKIAEKEGAPGLKAVFMTSERLPGDVRSWMEDVWRCPVYMGFGVLGIYPAVAMESPKRDKYIINELSYLVEIAPRNRQEGEIHITPLNFRCRPVLRLATGTRGKLIPAENAGSFKCRSLAGLEYVPGSLLTIGDLYFDADRFLNIASGRITGLDKSVELIWKSGVATLRFNIKPEDRATFMRILAETDPGLMKNVRLGMLSVEFADK